MKRLFGITACCIVLIGCGGSSTNGGISQGANTGFFSGAYEGALELKATVEAIGTSPNSANASVTVEVEITENGTVRLTIDDITSDGIVNEDGNWAIEITINGFGSLIDGISKMVKSIAVEIGAIGFINVELAYFED